MLNLQISLQIFYSFDFSYMVFNNCQFYARIEKAIITCLIFQIGMFVSYYMYITVAIIYQFSKTGTLPKEVSKRRRKHVFLGFSVLSIALCVIYISLCIFWGIRTFFYHKLDVLFRVFAIITVAVYSFNTVLLVLIIRMLKRAKVTSTDTGHLKLVDASILLGLLIVIILLTSLIAVKPLHETRLTVNFLVVKECTEYLIGIMYFKMGTSFITNFKLQTKVNDQGSCEIVGIDTNGHEIFVFVLDNETRASLLGILQASKDSDWSKINNHQSKQRHQSKNTFDLIESNSHLNDFTDGGTSDAITTSNLDDIYINEFHYNESKEVNNDIQINQ